MSENRRDFRMCPIDLIQVEGNIRDTEDDLEMDDLRASIREFGIIEPLILRMDGESLILVAGHRRLFAARKEGFDVVPCVVQQIPEADTFRIQVHENLHRVDVGKIDLAHAIRREMDVLGCTQADIARMIGKSTGYVSQVLGILQWDGDLIDAYDRGEIGFDVAKEIATEKSPEKREKMLQYAVAGGASLETIRKWKIYMSDENTKEEDSTFCDTHEPALEKYQDSEAFCNVCGKKMFRGLLRVVWCCVECRDALDEIL